MEECFQIVGITPPRYERTTRNTHDPWGGREGGTPIIGGHAGESRMLIIFHGIDSWRRSPYSTSRLCRPFSNFTIIRTSRGMIAAGSVILHGRMPLLYYSIELCLRHARHRIPHRSDRYRDFAFPISYCKQPWISNMTVLKGKGCTDTTKSSAVCFSHPLKAASRSTNLHAI
ncbi:hypothetical protein BJV82DRAFT_620281 [Fennellomyces sp. T-0311]|nr:hypothetical protein BJV82DRAFT_620281 [Fennellomyces sp. T-0311]